MLIIGSIPDGRYVNSWLVPSLHVSLIIHKMHAWLAIAMVYLAKKYKQ